MSDALSYDEVVLGRRSIRGYLDKPVPRDLLEEVLTLAMRSPTSMNTQPWHFHIITGEPLDRIRKGNTERILAGEPDSREFRRGEPSPAYIANVRSALPNSCLERWGSGAKIRTRARLGAKRVSPVRCAGLRHRYL